MNIYLFDSTIIMVNLLFMTIVVLVVFIENGITSTTPKNALKDKSTLTMAHAPYEWDFISRFILYYSLVALTL